jgi:hypothetical protein
MRRHDNSILKICNPLCDRSDVQARPGKRRLWEPPLQIFYAVVPP